MAGRKIVDEAEARRFVAAARRKGQSTGEWVKGRGIDGRSLQAWTMTFGRKSLAGPKRRRSSPARVKPKTLVELVPKPAAVTRTAKYIIERDGVRLEFGDDFADDTLRRVLLVLRSC
jgi:hypothetical protein